MFRIAIFISLTLLFTGCASLPQDNSSVTIRISNLEEENLRLAKMIDILTLRVDALSLRIDQIFQSTNMQIPVSLDGNTTTNTPNSPGKVETNKDQTKTKNANKVQCSATTKKGTRCSRMTLSPNGLCWQHGGN